MRYSGYMGRLASATSVMALAVLAGGCVHEFPDGGGVPPSLEVNLSFDLGMPVHEIVPYPQVRADQSHQNVEMRYNLWAWNLDKGEDIAKREPEMTLQWTGDNLTNPDSKIHIDKINPGTWKFYGWADLADAATGEPIAYDIESPSAIKLITERDGSFEAVPWADAFRGEDGVAICCADSEQLNIEMTRPVGAFEFISTDLAEFVDEQTRRNAETKSPDSPDRVVDINDYVVGYYINGFFPTEFDNLRNVPVDARTGLYASGKINPIDDGTGNLGGCYVLVNGKETMVSVTVRVYDHGEVIATSLPVEVPVVRGKKTLIKGEFLTANAGSGIGISPGFDGEYNYEVQ